MRWGALGLAVARGRADLGKKIAVEDEKGKKATVGKAFPLFFSMNRRKRGLGFSPSRFSPFRRRRNLKEKSPVVNPWKVLKEQRGGAGAIESFEGDIRLSFLCFFVRRFGRQEQERERFKLLEGFCLPEPFMQLTPAVGSAWHIYSPYSTSHRVVRSVRI